MQVYETGDLEKDHLSGATVAVLGYGNQGHAHARNLRDSGVRVTIGARRGREAWSRAERDSFPTETIDEAVRGADFVAMLLPDESHATVYTENVKPNLRAGAALVFAHGFSIAFGEIPVDGDHDILLVAPKGQGHYLRKSFTDGVGLSCLVAVGNEASGDAQQRLLSYAQGIGCLQAGAIETTFREEAVTDLFGEQAVLCGGVPSLVKASFDVLVSKGYSPEVAYIECLHELKIITDLMVEGGIAFMRKRISGTAAWGSFETGPELVSKQTREKLEAVLEGIESGEFAERWREEARNGKKRLKELIKKEADHPIERAGDRVRALMLRRKEDRT